MKKITKYFYVSLFCFCSAINVFAAETVSTPLTLDMFHKWTSVYEDATQTSEATGAELNLNKDLSGGGLVCGTGSVYYLTYADLTGYTKIVFEGTAGLPLRVMMNRVADEGALTEKQVTINESGIAEVSLVGLEYVHLNAVKLNWGEHKGQITAINLIKEEVEEEVLPEHYSKLTDIMFKAWDDPVNPTTSKGAGCAYVLKESTGLPYGDANVYYLNYADLTGYDKLEVTVSEGTPRFCFNRLVDQGATSENEVESKLIDIPNTKWATERYQTVEGNVYTINLQLMTEEKGYARLNCIKGANWANVTVTSMYLIKENERIEISESGLATFACEYALDFTTATKVAAYKAAVSNGVVNLAKVGKVAAGEGVLVRSVGGGSVAESIPYAEGEVSANDGNAFIGNLRTISSQASEDENYKYYILGYTEANGYGFYLANNKTIASGKAYLKVSKTDESSAKATFFSLDGETTGIVNVGTVAPISEANIYDLSGRIVKNPVKGLYIINGKKYIVK